MAKSVASGRDILLMALNGIIPVWFQQPMFIALHNADPTASGLANAFETVYGGYARVAISPVTGSNGWSVVNNIASNNQLTLFPMCNAGGDTITNWSLTTALTGPSEILYTSALAAPLVVAPYIQPQFPQGSLIIQEG